MANAARYDLTVTKDKSGSDNAQVPAGATVDFFKQGVTVTSSATVANGQADVVITVRDTGRLIVGDHLQKGTNSTPTIMVTEILTATTIEVASDANGALSLAVGDRLVATTNRPTVYKESTTVDAYPTSQVTTDAANGVLGPAYLKQRFFDAIISGSGLTSRLLPDQSAFRDPTFNVMDFPDVATALAAVAPGARLYFPASGGPYIPPSAAGWTIPRSMEIFSDGPGIPEANGFVFNGGSANQNSHMFTIADGVSSVYIHDIVISNGVGTPTGTAPPDGSGNIGCGIRYVGESIPTNILLERCRIHYAGFNCLRLAGSSFIVTVAIRDCTFRGARGDCVFINQGNQVVIQGSGCSVGKRRGLAMVGCSNVVIGGCDFEGNGADLSNGTFDGQLYLESTFGASIHGCNVEEFVSNASVKNGIVINAGGGIALSGNEFGLSSPSSGSFGIRLHNGARGCKVSANSFSNVDTTVIVGSGEGGNTIDPQCAINVSSPNARGILEIPSGGRNFALLNNLVSGVADNKGAVLVLPNVGTDVLDTSVLLNGAVWFDGTNFKCRVGGATKTITIA